VPEGPESPQGPNSSVFARLASGAFCETIVLQTFYEFIKFDPKILLQAGEGLFLKRYGLCARRYAI